MNFIQALTHMENLLKEATNTNSYRWGKKQDNSFDGKTKFIYQIKSYSELLKMCEYEKLSPELTAYAKNRWLNFKSAKAIEAIFFQHPSVMKEDNQYHQYIDFYINGINFDHKTSQFPKGFRHTLEYALEHKRELIEWLYKEQSGEKRKHFENRLFLVLYDTKNNQHWKLKSNLKDIYTEVTNYLDNFNENNLVDLDKGLLEHGESSGEVIYSDVIWYIR